MNESEMIFEKYMSIRESSNLFGPVYHRTAGNIEKLSDFDISKADHHSVLGPAIYATYENSKWNPISQDKGKILKGYVSGDIIDLTKSLNSNDAYKISKVIGRKIDIIPSLTLEKRFGSIAEGLKKCGYSAAIHEGPGASGKHIAIFSPEYIVDVMD